MSEASVFLPTPSARCATFFSTAEAVHHEVLERDLGPLVHARREVRAADRHHAREAEAADRARVQRDGVVEEMMVVEDAADAVAQEKQAVGPPPMMIACFMKPPFRVFSVDFLIKLS